MFCMRCGAPLPDHAQFCYHCGTPIVPAPTAPQAAPPATAAPNYMHPAPGRRRPSGVELAGDILALLGIVVLIVDYWADWWVLLVLGLFLLVFGLILYVVAWSQRPRAMPAAPVPPPYQPPPRA